MSFIIRIDTFTKWIPSQLAFLGAPHLNPDTHGLWHAIRLRELETGVCRGTCNSCLFWLLTYREPTDRPISSLRDCIVWNQYRLSSPQISTLYSSVVSPSVDCAAIYRSGSIQRICCRQVADKSTTCLRLVYDKSQRSRICLQQVADKL